MKIKFSNLTMPSRILFSAKIVKGREQRPMKIKFSNLTMPSRILFSAKIVKHDGFAGAQPLFFSQFFPFESADGLFPFVADGGGCTGFDVESHHDGAAYPFYLPGFGVDNLL